MKSSNVLTAQAAAGRILDAAESLLARFGYRKMTMEDVARSAGMGKGTIYLHFESKEEVVLATVDRIVERLLVRLEEIRKKPSSPDVRLKEVLIERVMFRFDSVRGYHESLSELLVELRSELLVRRKRYFALEVQLLVDLILEGQQTHHFVEVDAEPLASAALTATNSLLPLTLSARELGTRSFILKEVTAVADLLINGILRK